MRLLLATSNPHKLEEIVAVVGADRVEWWTLDRLARERGLVIDEPVEDAPTFEGNAVKKAAHYAAAAGMTTLADDSGLSVDALDGAPGVRSARYSGASGPRSVVDPANNAKLLEALRGVPVAERGAAFVCAMAMVEAGRPRISSVGFGDAWVVRGEVRGRILLPEEADDPTQPARGRGAHGFGYDPLFVLPDDHPRFPGKTTAELAPHDKNAISHRGAAARKWWDAVVAG